MSTRIGWIVWGLSAFLYGYGFFQRVAPGVMIDELMREFAVGGAALGNLAAFYFYAYASLQIPIGIMLDRWGARRVIAAAALLCGFGSALFGLSETLTEAYAGRLLIGMGASVGWIGALFVAMRWLPPERFAFVSGLTIFAGMSGALMAQAPLAALIEIFGWRHTMLVSGILALIAGMIFYVAAREAPAIMRGTMPGPSAKGTGLLSGLRLALGDAQNWRLAIFAASLAGPMAAFTGLWSVGYVMQTHGLSRPAAASMTSIVLIGWALGGPAAGWLSDRLRLRKPVLLATGILMLSAWLALLGLPRLSLTQLGIVFFVAGLGGGGMVIAFTLAREITPSSRNGVVSGLINTVVMGVGALLQPWVGFLLDVRWDGTLIEGARIYATGAYEFAFLTFPAVAILGLTAGAFTRETYCRPVDRD